MKNIFKPNIATERRTRCSIREIVTGVVENGLRITQPAAALKEKEPHAKVWGSVWVISGVLVTQLAVLLQRLVDDQSLQVKKAHHQLFQKPQETSAAK